MSMFRSSSLPETSVSASRAKSRRQPIKGMDCPLAVCRALRAPSPEMRHSLRRFLRGGGEMRHFFGLIIVAVLAATLAAAASADSAYHTERLDLHGLNGAPGGGMVVNVHPNGPIVYAHEVYTLSG